MQAYAYLDPALEAYAVAAAAAAVSAVSAAALAAAAVESVGMEVLRFFSQPQHHYALALALSEHPPTGHSEEVCKKQVYCKRS